MTEKKFLLTLQALLLFLAFHFTAYSQTEFEPFWGINNSPKNDDVRVLSVDSNDVLYAAVWGDGIYKSTNDAVSWQRVSNGLSNPFVTCIEIDSLGIVYAGTFGDGIFKSTNQGAQWTQVSTEFLNDLNVKAIAIYPNGDILAGTYGGGVARLDTSNKWRILNRKMTFMDVNCLVIPDDSIIVAGTNGGGIFRSSDAGASWVNVSTCLRSYTVTDMCLGKYGDIYAATLGGGVVRSQQDGTGWEVYFDRSNHPMNATCIEEVSYENPIVGTNDRGVVRCDVNYISSSTPWRNTDRTFYGVNDIAVNSKGYVFTAQPFNGLLRSMDGGYEYDWQTVQHFNLSGIGKESGVSPLWTDGTSMMFCSSLEGGIFRSSDKGHDWELIDMSGVTVSNYSKDSEGNYYVACGNGAYKSTDKGINWEPVGWYNEIFDIAVNDDGDIFVIDSAVRRSTDDGETWEMLGIWADSNFYNFIEIGPNGYIYCNQISESKDPNVEFGLKVSTDNGDTWNLILSTEQTYPLEMAFYGNTIYAATTNGLYISNNYGTTWATADFGYSFTAFVPNVVVAPDGDVIVFEGGTQFIMKSEDHGATWDTLWGGMIKGNIAKLAVNDDNDMFASTTVLYRSISNEDLVVPDIVYPKNDISGQPQYPTLDWNSVHNADLYEVHISQDPEFSDDEINETAIISATDWKLIYPLEFNRKYFWRVRSKRNKSVSAWSEPASFYTETEPPALIYPEAHSFGIDTVITFSWYKVEGANSYHIQISENEVFDGIFEQKENITDSLYDIDGLSLEKNYYWRARALSSKGTSAWSEIRKFTTKMPAPELIKPLENAYVPYNIVSFSWDKLENAEIYDIQVARDSIFDDVVYEGPTDNDSTHQLLTLTYGVSYYWRIKGRSDTNYSYWSETRKFTTDLEAAILVNPVNHSNNLEIPIEFNWDATKDATSFQFQLAHDEEFENIIYDVSDLEDKSLIYEEALEFGTYYWRVRIFADELPGLWAEPWSFSINPGYVELLKPENNANNVGKEDRFEWDGPDLAEAYHIQVAADEAFADIVYEKEELSSKSQAVSQAGLDVATTYFWRMRLIADGIPGLWSEIFSFTTGLAAPTLITPLNDAVNVNVNCEFSWQSVSQAEHYKLQIAKDKNFSDIKHDIIDISGTKHTVTLDSGTTYYWRVMALYSGGEGDWSYIRNLKTEGPPSSIKEFRAIVSEITTKPNPLNELTEIELLIKTNSRIKVEIINSDGMLIESLKEGFQAPGNLSLIWKPAGIPQGVYYLRITADGREYLKKLIYLK